MKIDGHDYGVNIIGSDENPIKLTRQGYAPLAHGEHYKIVLKGNAQKRSAAEISIDGEKVGNFIVPIGREVIIERPADIAKLFTFFKADSDEAKQALLHTVEADKLGVISVKFVPEKYQEPVRLSMSPSPMRLGFNMRGSSFDAGGTGLSGNSNQTFREVYFDGDENQAVTLNLRLSYDPQRVINPDIRSLPGRLPKSNPVPPPVTGEDGPK